MTETMRTIRVELTTEDQRALEAVRDYHRQQGFRERTDMEVILWALNFAARTIRPAEDKP